MTNDASSTSCNEQCCGNAQPGQAGSTGGSCHCNLPQVTFSTFILSLASSALVQLGEVPNPETGQMETDLMLANHSIEILAMLHEKTRGCLESDEARLMEEILYELRMKYVMKKK